MKLQGTLFYPTRGKAGVKIDKPKTHVGSIIYTERGEDNAYMSGVIISIELPIPLSNGIEITPDYKVGDRVLVEKKPSAQQGNFGDVVICWQDDVVMILDEDTVIG